jgi:hypothetical protein
MSELALNIFDPKESSGSAVRWRISTTSLAKVVTSSSFKISVTQMRRDAYHAERNEHGRQKRPK